MGKDPGSVKLIDAYSITEMKSFNQKDYKLDKEELKESNESIIEKI